MRKKQYVPDYDVTFFAHGSTPRVRKPAGVAVVGRMRATRDLLEVARPVDVENKSLADLIALRLAIEMAVGSGASSAFIVVSTLDEVEGYVEKWQVAGQDTKIHPGMGSEKRDLMLEVLRALDEARHMRLVIHNRKSYDWTDDDPFISELVHQAKELASRCSNERSQRQIMPAAVLPLIRNTAVADDPLGLSAVKWNALVEQLVEVGLAKSGAVDTTSAELGIRRAMAAFHQTLEHVRAA